MRDDDMAGGPILRFFEARAKPGRSDVLVAKFSEVSAAVVVGEPGNHGYFFGANVTRQGEDVVFASLWANLDAIRTRFGADWRESYMPDGYDDLIEACRVRHFHLADGWHVTI